MCRDVLQQLGLQHAYLNLVETTKPRPLLQSILTQLKVCWTPMPCTAAPSHLHRSTACDSQVLHAGMPCCAVQGKKRKAEAGYCGDCRCDAAAEFLLQLPEVAPPSGPAKVIVLDNVQRMAKSDLLAAILKAQELTGDQAVSAAFLAISSA